jgi:hypothetical protein
MSTLNQYAYSLITLKTGTSRIVLTEVNKGAPYLSLQERTA